MKSYNCKQYYYNVMKSLNCKQYYYNVMKSLNCNILYSGNPIIQWIISRSFGSVLCSMLCVS